MASILGTFASAFFEIDEVEASRVGNEVYYTFVTTGLGPSVAELKTKLWAYMAPPVKRLEVLSIEPLEEGPVAKRYKIRVKGRILTETLGKEEYRLFPLKSLRR